MSGWSADNAESAPPAAGVGGPGAPTNDAPPTWASPAAAVPAEPAWALPEVGLGGGVGGPPSAGPAPITPIASSSATAGGWTSEPEAVAPPRLPVPLRAMTATDIIDGAWGIIKARPRTVFAVTAMIILPVEVVASFLARGSLAIQDLAASQLDGPSSSRLALGSAGVLTAQLLQNLAPFFLGGALARLVSSWYAGGDMTARQAATAALRKAPALLGAFAILLPIKLLGWGVSCGVALIFVLPLVMVTAPAIVIENLGPWTGPKRAFDLARRRYWACIGVWALALLVEQTVNLALALVPSLLSNLVPGPIESVVAAAGTVFAAFISKPFMVGVAVLLYLDLRVRTEGLDLELEVDDAFARAA